MLAMDLPIASGDLQLQLNPTAEVRYVDSSLLDQRSWAAFSSTLSARWSGEDLRLNSQAECRAVTLLQAGSYPLLWKSARANPQTVICRLNEGFAEYGGWTWNIHLGKSRVGSSAARLTSPSNPSGAGLVLPGVFESKEGIWNSRFSWTPSDKLSLTAGVATDWEGYQASPWLSGKWTEGRWDLSLTGSEAFLGAATSIQVLSGTLAYLEANLHQPKGSSAYRGDFLAGVAWSPATFPSTISLEYYRNSQGTRQSENFFLQGPSGLRENLYRFPAPATELPALWGSSDFLGVNYLYLEAYPLEGYSGPLASALWNGDDGSSSLKLGYVFQKIWEEGKLEVFGRGFTGEFPSEFGAVGRSQGSFQLGASFQLGI